MNNPDQIIKSHVLWALGGGLIPIPLADFVAVTAIQLDMVKDLCQVHGVPYEQQQGRTLISALAGTSLASIGASVVKAIPVIGSILGGVSMSIMSGATTYALGGVFDKHFSEGGTLDNFDVEDIREYYANQVEVGKKMAKKWQEQEKAAKNEPLTREKFMEELKKLETLRENGVISETEYEAMRQQLLSRYMN